MNDAKATPESVDDRHAAEQWMVDRYGTEMGALSVLNDVYAIRRHVRDAYMSGLREGRSEKVSRG